MKARDWIEISLVPVAVASLAVASQGHLPREVEVGSLLTAAALLLLLQGLVRDLYLLVRQRSAPSAPRRRMRCMCLESSVGLGGVLLGIGLAVLLPAWRLPLTTGGVVVGSSAVLVFGYATKDLVVTWGPVGLRRDPDHANIIPVWR